MKLSTPLPPSLKQRILDSIADLEKQKSKTASARQDSQSKITALQTAAAECEARTTALKSESLASDQAAGQLANVERRALAISIELSNLRKSADAAPGLDLVGSLITLLAVVDWYREAVKQDILTAIAPLHMPENLALPLFAHCECIMVLNSIRDFVILIPPPTISSANRIAKYLQRALAGNINLHRDTPHSGDAAHVETAPVDNPT
jgi:hypothetical protein